MALQDFQQPWIYRAIKAAATALGARMTAAESSLTTQGNRLSTAEGNVASVLSRLGTNDASDAALTARMAAAEAGLSTLSVVNGGPYTVQTGGANPLMGIPTTGLKPCIAVVSDMGGCGAAGAPGPGLALWTGTEWRRLSRGVQATMNPAASITLDYWRDPWRVKLTGTTVTATAFLLANSKVGHLVAIYKPGLTGALLNAFTVALASVPGNTLPILGPALAFIEYDGSGIAQVQTS